MSCSSRDDFRDDFRLAKSRLQELFLLNDKLASAALPSEVAKVALIECCRDNCQIRGAVEIILISNRSIVLEWEWAIAEETYEYQRVSGKERNSFRFSSLCFF